MGTFSQKDSKEQADTDTKISPAFKDLAPPDINKVGACSRYINQITIVVEDRGVLTQS